MAKQNEPPPRPRYIWPWYVLGGFILGVALAVVWVRAEARRLQEQKGFSFVPQPQNRALPTSTPTSTPSPLGLWTNDMVWIPGGTFAMGADDGQPDEKPVHQVTVDG